MSRLNRALRLRRRPALRPRLELLEGRIVLTAIAWNNPSGGLFSVASNWSPQVVPGASDDISFNLSGNYTVTFNQNAASSQITVDNDHVTLDLGSRTYAVGTINVGYNTGTRGQFEITNGSVTASSIVSVGLLGSGELDLRNSGRLTSVYGIVGQYTGSGGAAVVSGVGSSWALSQSLTLGQYATTTGTLDVMGGAVVTTPTATLGDHSQATGLVRVSGTGSSFQQAGGSALILGRSGLGTLKVSAGASASANDTRIGFNSGATGSLTVDGVGSTFTGSYTYVGYGGAGFVNVTKGAALNLTGAGLIAGYMATGAGSVSVDGTGSSITTSEIELGGGIEFSDSGAGFGHLEVTNGAKATGTGFLGNKPGSNGTALVRGAGSRWTTGAVQVGVQGKGSLTIDQGGLVTGSGTTSVVGGASGSEGTVLVDGTGSTWGSVRAEIGSAGKGTLSVTGGGTVTPLQIKVGTQAGSVGTVTVDGVGSNITGSSSSPGLVVGESGQGSLSVVNGGTVNGLNNPVLGYNASGNGTVTVSGPGSSWVIRSTRFDFSDLVVGYSGIGSLSILKGGVVTHTYLGAGGVGRESTFALNPGSRGTVVVDGTGSSWSPDTLVVSQSGLASLQISNGAVLTSGSAYVARGVGSGGTVTLVNSGSTWTTSSLNVGGDDTAAGGTGSVTVSDSAKLTAAGLVKAWTPGSVTLDGGTLIATSTVLAAGLLTGSGTVGAKVTNSGEVRPGKALGTLNINGDYAQDTNGRLTIELGGTIPVTQFDVLNVAGIAQLGGTLTISLANGFRPRPGDSFLVIKDNSQTGAFTKIEGLDLGNGLILQPTYTATGLTLSVPIQQVVVALSVSPISIPEAAGVATVTATLSAVSGLPTTINLGVGGTASNGADYTLSATSITIPAGKSTGSVTITAVQDALYEGNETVIVSIVSVTNGTAGGSPVTVTIVDDDPAPTVTLALSGSPMAENGGVAIVTATLSAVSTQDVMVNLSFSGSAGSADYTPSGSSIAIPAGKISGSITLTGIADTLVEGPENIIVDIVSVSNGTELGTQQVTATIIDQSLLVSTTADSGTGSLRQAILNANAHVGLDTISFSIDSGVQTIRPTSALPEITDPLIINGSSQPGFAGHPIIVIDGTIAGIADGLRISAGKSVVRGLVFDNFIQSYKVSGIHLLGAGGNIVETSYVGVDATGTMNAANYAGIHVDNSPNNTIGGTGVGAGDLISDNFTQGILIDGSTSTGNLIVGNLIGTNIAGMSVVGNGQVGVMISNAPGNVIGGAGVAARNIISGNTNGIVINGSAAGTAIQGNYIGTNITGTAALGNSVGVYISYTSSTMIGGNSAGQGNLISGNGYSGIVLDGSDTRFTDIWGDMIGTDVTGTRPLGNGMGVRVSNSFNNYIGGVLATQSNVISGNHGPAIQFDLGSNSNVVWGNRIGTDAFGAPLSNAGDGILISESSYNNIGVLASGAGNTIGFNGGSGVSVLSGIGNSIIGNSISSNSGLGIDLGGDGVTLNDTNDADVGPNSLENFPTILAARPGSSTRIVGFFQGAAGTFHRLAFYSSPTANHSGYGEGQRYLGSIDVTTSGAGRADYTTVLSAVTSPGEVITSTATDAYGSTSEFSAAVAVDSTAPKILSVAGVAPNPRNSSVTTVDLVLSEPIDLATFTAADLTLILNGGSNLITDAVTITPLSGSTYRINGLGGLSGSDGTYVLTVSAAGLSDIAGNPGTGSATDTWLMDTIKPASAVKPLDRRQLSLSFPVRVTGTDPAPAAGVPASGVASFDVSVAIDGGPFLFWVTVPAAQPSAVFIGQSNHTYAFHSTAHDKAGNVEFKGAGTIEASTFVPDLDPPQTAVSAINADAPAFVVRFRGTDAGGSSLATFEIYAQVDGGAVRSIGRVAAGTPDGTGVYSGTLAYQAIADGSAHTYRFFSVGVDGNGNVELAPSDPAADVVVTRTFAVPQALKVTAFQVQKGMVQRSFVRFADLTFNQSGAVLDRLVASINDADPSNDRIRLTKFDLNGQNGSPVPIGGRLAAVDHAIDFDFGAEGLGGNRNTMAGDGYYVIALDLDGNGTFETDRRFYRLLGDVNGDRSVDNLDLVAISAAMGHSGPGLEQDVNGDGFVNALDLTLASRSRGRKLAAGLRLDG